MRCARLVDAQRMRCVDKGNPQRLADLAGNVSRVGEVRVDQVGQALARLQFGNKRCGKCCAVGGEIFFGQIAAVAAVDPNDCQAGANFLALLCMNGAQMRRVEQACDDLPSHDAGLLDESPHSAEDIGDMSAGILGQPVFRLPPEAATEGQRHNFHSISDPVSDANRTGACRCLFQTRLLLSGPFQPSSRLT